MSYFAHETSIVDDDCHIGDGTKIWHFSHILSGSEIGGNCSFGQNCVVGPKVKMGSGIKVQNNISIYEGVEVEDNVFLGPSMVFTNVINPRSAVNRKEEFLKTIVKKGASIGANATIICGNNIGKYSFIGAGAVVTKTVADYSLVVGNPSKHIGWVSEYGHRLNFNSDNKATCEESRQVYQLENEIVKRIK